jgi:hypothetical protein
MHAQALLLPLWLLHFLPLQIQFRLGYSLKLTLTLKFTLYLALPLHRPPPLKQPPPQPSHSQHQQRTAAPPAPCNRYCHRHRPCKPPAAGAAQRTCACALSAHQAWQRTRRGRWQGGSWRWDGGQEWKGRGCGHTR